MIAMNEIIESNLPFYQPSGELKRYLTIEGAEKGKLRYTHKLSSLPVNVNTMKGADLTPRDLAHKGVGSGPLFKSRIAPENKMAFNEPSSEEARFIDYDDLRKIAEIIVKAEHTTAHHDKFRGKSELKTTHALDEAAYYTPEVYVTASALGAVMLLLFSGLLSVSFIYRIPIIHPLLGLMLMVSGLGFYIMGRLSRSKPV